MWLHIGAAPEADGIVISPHTDESSDRRGLVGDQPCLSTDIAHAKYYIDFRTEPEFFLPEHDTVTVVIEYFDSGTAPIMLQYLSATPSVPGGYPYRTAPLLKREGTEEWRVAYWQLTDPLFPTLAHGIGFRLHAEGWMSPDRELHVASIVVNYAALKLVPAAKALPADGEATTEIQIQVTNPTGAPPPEGTEVALECEGAHVPARVALAQGHGTAQLTAGREPRTVWVTAVTDALALQHRIPVFLVPGDGELELRHTAFAGDALANGVEVVRTNAREVEITVGADPAGPDVLTVRAHFPAELESDPMAILALPEVRLPGALDTLTLEVVGGEAVNAVMCFYQDGTGETLSFPFVPYGAWAVAAGEALEIAAHCPSSNWGGNGDFVLDPPVRLGEFLIMFEPGCREGVLHVRSIGATSWLPQQAEGQPPA